MYTVSDGDNPHLFYSFIGEVLFILIKHTFSYYAVTLFSCLCACASGLVFALRSATAAADMAELLNNRRLVDTRLLTTLLTGSMHTDIFHHFDCYSNYYYDNKQYKSK